MYIHAFGYKLRTCEHRVNYVARSNNAEVKKVHSNNIIFTRQVQFVL